LKQIRKRLTYANVMSSIAVFLVVGGATAFAAGHLGKNTVGTKQLKNNAVTTAKIKNGAVTGSKVKLSSLGTVPSATNAANATTAANAAALGGASPSSYQTTSNLLFATVAPGGPGAKLVRGRGVTAVESSFPGQVVLKFNRDITGCTWLATYGPPGNSFVSSEWATIRGLSGNNELLVVLRNEEGEEESGSGVHVAVLCP
jgi:hypothetical protein